VLVALVIGGTTLLALAPVASASTTTDSAEAAFFADLNSLRASQGLSALIVDTRLVTIARAWSVQMAAAGAISHNPNLTALAPASWQALGENVGVGPTEPSLNSAFINSPHHYANMVDPSYNTVGIGVVMAGTSIYVTVDFAQLPAPVPATLLSAPSGPSSGSGTSGTTSGPGWMAASDGGIFAFGGAAFLGSMGGHHLNQAIVGMASTPSGNGYWLVARDGGIFAYGDARFFGSTGSIRLNSPIVGIGQAPSGGGYWLVAADGGLFGFGSAGFYGSTASSHLAQPIVGMTATASGHGYVLASGDGNVFAFGDATDYGSPTGLVTGAVIGITGAATGGYELGTSAGRFLTVNASGTALAATGALSQPIVAISSLL
jgi:hypothetical protein